MLWSSPQFARNAFAGVALGVLACAVAPGSTVQEQRQLGVREGRLIRQSFTMLRDRIVVSYVRELGTKLSEGAAATPFPLSFYILEHATPSAFAVPGGSIYVSSGILLEARNPDELAGVLAHVIAHVAAQHEVLQYQQAGNRPGAFAVPFSAKAERRAKDLAVSALESAGYDPRGLARLVERLRARPAPSDRLQQQVPPFVVAHPLPPDDHRADANGENSGSPDSERLREVQERIRLIQG